MNNKFLIFLESFYILFLSATIGAILILGIFVAPTIFTTDLLTQNESGLLMTNIFVKTGYWLYILIFMIFAFEGYRYKNGKMDKIVLASGFVVIFTALLFTDFYTPQIIEMLVLQETQTETFKNTHFASELDFKVLLVALLVLSFRRIWKLFMIKESKK
jgi:hypothetical protein